MGICSQYLSRMVQPISGRSAWRAVVPACRTFRDVRLASTSAPRPPMLFFSSNVGSTLVPEVERGAKDRWEKDVALDIPFVPTPSIPTEYPPPPFEAYKPVAALTSRRLVRIYVQLSKARLTSLVMLTAMSGVALSPLHAGVPVLLATAAGTALCSASANAINQILEAPFDAQMARTRNRPLVRRAVSPLHTAGFAVITSIAGPAILLTMVNPLTAALGAFNIVLYAGAYTLLKRRTVWNTYVGAVVGAIPPVMGWTACGGQLIPSSPYPIHFFPPSFLSSLPPADLALISSSTADNPLAPLALFAFLFCWQFPHFNSLSHLIRASYAQAGYRMLSVTSPAKNALESLQYAAVLVPICSILIPASGLTSWAFALTSLPVNAVALRAAWRFWKDGKERSARTVTQYSLLYLPVMLGLMMFHKHGMEWSKWLGLSSGEGQVEPNRQA